MKSARVVIMVAALLVIAGSGAGIVLSDDIGGAIPPAAVCMFTCISLYAVLRRPLRPPKPWDRKRLVLSVALTVPLVAFFVGVAVVPMITQTEDSVLRAGAVAAGAIVFGSLALGVLIARREHRLARNATQDG